VLVQGTLWGNLILGPTARDVHNPAHHQTREEIVTYLLEKCRELVPAFDAR
jgi:glycerol-3-phosphate dehydrogenase